MEGLYLMAPLGAESKRFFIEDMPQVLMTTRVGHSFA